MTRRTRTDFPGAVHHVFGRGNDKRPIFQDDEDCRTFLHRMIEYQGATGVKILAYCLMINHYHLVTQTADVPLNRFMHRLLTSYTRIVNDRWVRVGHLFQGRYSARRCKTDREACVAIRYVHLNPVEAGLVSLPGEWAWSGHRGLVSGSDPILDVPAVAGMFGGAAEYEAFLQLPLARQGRRSMEVLAAGVAGPAARLILSQGPKTPDIVGFRRQFVVQALQEGYRRSEIARYLGRSAASITKLLREEVKAED